MTHAFILLLFIVYFLLYTFVYAFVYHYILVYFERRILTAAATSEHKSRGRDSKRKKKKTLASNVQYNMHCV